MTLSEMNQEGWRDQDVFDVLPNRVIVLAIALGIGGMVMHRHGTLGGKSRRMRRWFCEFCRKVEGLHTGPWVCGESCVVLRMGS